MIGQMVSKYRILEEIGRGSMAIVFQAQDTFLGRNLALKILPKSWSMILKCCTASSASAGGLGPESSHLVLLRNSSRAQKGVGFV
jgi:hypothetical protein